MVRRSKDQGGRLLGRRPRNLIDGCRLECTTVTNIRFNRGGLGQTRGWTKQKFPFRAFGRGGTGPKAEVRHGGPRASPKAQPKAWAANPGGRPGAAARWEGS